MRLMVVLSFVVQFTLAGIFGAGHLAIVGGSVDPVRFAVLLLATAIAVLSPLWSGFPLGRFNWLMLGSQSVVAFLWACGAFSVSWAVAFIPFWTLVFAWAFVVVVAVACCSAVYNVESLEWETECGEEMNGNEDADHLPA